MDSILAMTDSMVADMDSILAGHGFHIDQERFHMGRHGSILVSCNHLGCPRLPVPGRFSRPLLYRVGDHSS